MGEGPTAAGTATAGELAAMAERITREMLDGGSVEAIVRKHVEKTLDDVVKDAFGRYGAFGKAIEQALKHELPGSVEKLEGVAKYNDLVAKMLRCRLNAFYDERARELTEKLLAQLFENPPAEIKLSRLVRSMKEYFSRDFMKSHRDGSRRMALEVQREGSFTRVAMDPDAKKAGYHARYWLSIYHNQGEDQEEVRYSRGTVHHVRINGADMSKELFTGPFHDFERDLFHLHACNTLLVLDDVDPESLRYGSDESEEG
jgi:hypothetical protein